MRRLLYSLLLLLLCLAVEAEGVEKLAGPAEAALLALDDAVTSAHVDVTTLRYLWSADPSVEFERGLALAVNSCLSRSAILYRPQRLAGGRLYRIDLAGLATDERELAELAAAYDALADIDPYFHANRVEVVPQEIVATRSAPLAPALPAALPARPRTRRVLRGRYYVHPDGRRQWVGNYWREVPADPIEYLQPRGSLDRDLREWAKIANGGHRSQEAGVARKTLPNEPAVVARKVTRIFAPYAGQALLDLAKITRSDAPLLRADWLVATASTTADDGRYYQLLGIRDSAGNQTAEQLLEQDLGVDPARFQKVALEISGVTHKPRAVDFTYGNVLRPTVGPGLFVSTRDVFDGTVDDDQHPLKNLLRTRFDGVETLFLLPNGLLGTALLDGAGNLAAEAPPNLVCDRTAPLLAPTRLVAPASCVRCHAKQEGWLDCRSDIRNLLKGPHLRVLGEGGKFLDRADAEQLLILYAGHIEEPLRIARSTLLTATFALTGLPTVREAFEAWVAIHDGYYWELVDARTALVELGYADPGVAAAPGILRLLLGRLADESATLTVLVDGGSVHRRTWERDYAEAITRAQASEGLLLIQKLKQLGD
jgi:hypothetical protein